MAWRGVAPPRVASSGKVASAVREGFLPPATLSGRLRFLVLDEADLLLSYGYEEDLQLMAPLVRGWTWLFDGLLLLRSGDIGKFDVGVV